MTAKKVHRILLVVLMLTIAGVIGALVVSNNFMAKNGQALIEAKLDNIEFDNAEQNYLQSEKYLEEYSDLNELMQKILPKSKDQAQAVSELYKIGDETGIKIASVQFPSSALGQKNTSSGTITQSKTVDGMPGVVGVEVSIQLKPASGASISYDNMISFLQKVELNRRSMQVKQITVNADVVNGGVTFDMIIMMFVKP